MFKTPLGAMVFVDSVTKSVAFYKDKLGFEFTGYWDGEKPAQEWTKPGEPPYAGFMIGGGHLGLHPNDGTRKAGNGMEFHVVVDNVDAYHKQITAKGASSTEPKDEDWGGRTITLKDPDGHIWDFYHMNQG